MSAASRIWSGVSFCFLWWVRVLLRKTPSQISCVRPSVSVTVLDMGPGNAEVAFAGLALAGGGQVDLPPRCPGGHRRGRRERRRRCGVDAEGGTW